MRQSVVDELMAQRDAVMFGTWVDHNPRTAREACLVSRGAELLTHDAQVRVAEARWRRGWLITDEVQDPGFLENALWNDYWCESASQAIEVLDEAIRLEKDA